MKLKYHTRTDFFLRLLLLMISKKCWLLKDMFFFAIIRIPKKTIRILECHRGFEAYSIVASVVWYFLFVPRL